MPKRSVYIPDGLWEEIQTHVRDLNLSVSEMVQNSLRSALGIVSGEGREGREGRGKREAPEAPRFRRPAADPDVMARLRRKFQKEAQASYEAGIHAGRALAEKVSWRQMSALAATGFAVPERPRDDPELFAVCDQVLAEAIGDAWVAILKADVPRARGVSDGLAEVWEFATGPG